MRHSPGVLPTAGVGGEPDISGGRSGVRGIPDVPRTRPEGPGVANRRNQCFGPYMTVRENIRLSSSESQSRPELCFMHGFDLRPVHNCFDQSECFRMIAPHTVVIAPPLDKHPNINVEYTEATA